MQGMSYEERIALGNQVPTLGQFQVIKQIPQYQTCEVHNLVPAPKSVPETLKHVVFNIERGVTLHETIDFLKMCPELNDIDIIYANELDDGAQRSGNQNVAMEIAKAIGMNHWQTMLHVIFPQALRNIVPQIGNNFMQRRITCSSLIKKRFHAGSRCLSTGMVCKAPTAKPITQPKNVPTSASSSVVPAPRR